VLEALLSGLKALECGNLLMFAVGGALIYLAVKKDYEPMLLLPIGFGIVLANIPLSSAVGLDGFLTQIYEVGIKTEIFPILIFIAVGAMIDFGPLLRQPIMLFYGAAAQFGIFATVVVAYLAGFDLREAVSIGVIGTADGPTSIYVAAKLAPHYLGAISVAAYSYMALVPLIQPPIIQTLTTEEERALPVGYEASGVSRTARVLFPIAVSVLAGVVAPASVELVGALMFGNLVRESGVLERLSQSAQNELANLTTLLLGITIGSTMTATNFLRTDTLLILGIGLAAFVFDTAGGVLFAKLMNLFLPAKINPMIGAAGISAFPMAARVVHKMGQRENPRNFLLMQAAGANVAGQIGSVVAGSVLLTLVLSVLGG